MSLILNDKTIAKPKENLSHRQRFVAYREEIRYCHERAAACIKSHLANHFKQTQCVIILTTPEKQRAILGNRMALDGLGHMLIAAGRLSSHDDKPADSRPVIRFVHRHFWASDAHAFFMEDLMEVYCVLVDSWHMAIAQDGEHALRVRHSKVTEKELRIAMKFITERIKTEGTD